MIHGLSNYSTSGAGCGLDYFLDDDYFDKEAQVWKPRVPAPELLEGDPEVIRALCESLDFKHKYTSGVLSFSTEETALIDATPGRKEALIQEFKDFAFAGIENADSRLWCLVEHRHLGRLEMHYMAPRVHAESGKYFNPFPPNYNGKRGPGSNQVFIWQNDAFVDHMCEKYGLQNPRDPQYKRPIELKQFDPKKNIKQQVIQAIDTLIDNRAIGGREDMIKFLENSGATITRKSSDYFSFKFEGMDKAVRLKGELYGERSFEQVAERHAEAIARFQNGRAGSESRYGEALAERTAETQGRHKIVGESIERAKRLESVSSNELASLSEEFKAIKNDLDTFSPGARTAARNFVANHPLIRGFDQTQIDGLANACHPELEVADVKTDDPVADELRRKLYNALKQGVDEAMAQSRKFFKQQQEAAEAFRQAFTRGFSVLFKFNLSTYSGRNFLSQDGYGSDFASNRRLISEHIKQLRDDMRYLKALDQQQRRVEQRILTPLGAMRKAQAGTGLRSDLSSLIEAPKAVAPKLDKLDEKLFISAVKNSNRKFGFALKTKINDEARDDGQSIINETHRTPGKTAFDSSPTIK
ncbi:MULTISPECIES: relaxase/mobilization nuclease domain-containing protein [unclassified Pseudomonas]|uniref:relaxase/mobilization nuclease domain-containing protein n=1 Tax=unclassified Pseudomonas TaxID=196821 RepID=UPI00119AAD26|nr:MULTISPECIES: relaxase/mobilization nuclease domain-containing protein [unclassified Pseudomonas]TWC13453.1 relaxase/mobilization nuclease-like protein [Pseudomonas sp. SJZ083]TWC42765.1 relaxase/mobilization nuclease-like protein [Pseudomonas sp. SJZ077]TWC60063.1 relaxase/mobilization nuclease-like protein [Pseudomonas sp. SJZ080]